MENRTRNGGGGSGSPLPLRAAGESELGVVVITRGTDARRIYMPPCPDNHRDLHQRFGILRIPDCNDSDDAETRKVSAEEGAKLIADQATLTPPRYRSRPAAAPDLHRNHKRARVISEQCQESH